MRYCRRKVPCIESVSRSPCIPVSTLKWGYKGALDNLCIIFSAYGSLYHESMDVSGRNYWTAQGGEHVNEEPGEKIEVV